jgi:hypothetical protein
MLRRQEMNKPMTLIFSLVPACITFGPLFMTRLGGTSTSKWAPMVGSFMLAIGLSIVFGVVAQQDKRIKDLQAKLKVGK